jgi:single-stranded DNA-binding protein
MARTNPATPSEPAAAPLASATSRPFGFAHFTVFGRLATAAELKFTAAGRPMAKATLATNGYGGQAHYLDVTVFGESAKTLGQYGSKGRGLVVYGRIDTHTWDAGDGGRRKSLDLVADEFHFADRAPAANGQA